MKTIFLSMLMCQYGVLCTIIHMKKKISTQNVDWDFCLVSAVRLLTPNGEIKPPLR